MAGVSCAAFCVVWACHNLIPFAFWCFELAILTAVIIWGIVRNRVTFRVIKQNLVHMDYMRLGIFLVLHFSIVSQTMFSLFC